MIQSFISWAWWCNQFLARAHYTTVHLYTARQIRCVQYNGVQCTVRPVLCGLCSCVATSAQSAQSRSLLQSSELQTWFKAVHQQQPGLRFRETGACARQRYTGPHPARAGSANWNISQHYCLVVGCLTLHQIYSCLLLINNFAWQCDVPLTHAWQCWVFAWLHISLISVQARCDCQGGRSLPGLAALDPGWDWASEAEWSQSCSDTQPDTAQQSAVIKWIMTQWIAKRSYPVCVVMRTSCSGYHGVSVNCNVSSWWPSQLHCLHCTAASTPRPVQWSLDSQVCGGRIRGVCLVIRN